MPAPRPLQQVLAADATLKLWVERQRRLGTLTAIVRRSLPRALAEHVRVIAAEGPELILASDAGASAAIVRQRGPDLLAALRRAGQEFSALRVRVQVRVDPGPPAKPVPKQLDRRALRPLAGLARELPPGPLKAALARFLRRAG